MALIHELCVQARLLKINMLLEIFQVKDTHYNTGARDLHQDHPCLEHDSPVYHNLQGLGFSPIKVEVLEAYLQNSDYDRKSSEILLKGFSEL